MNVLDARLTSPDRLALTVSSCNRKAEVSQLRETDVDMQVKVKAYIHPFLQGGEDCADLVEVQLQEPLGDRDVVDRRTGQAVKLRR